MKKFSIIAMVLAFTMMLSVVSFAADPAFKAVEKVINEDKTETVYGSYATVDGVEIFTTADEKTTLTSDEDSIDVTTAATAGNYYGILLVTGSDLPNKDNTILYINQATAAGDAQAFEVLPNMAELTAGDKLTLYISSNVAGANLIAIPMVWDEEKASYVVGDINNDGSYNSIDAVKALQIGLGIIEFTETERAAADVNEDGNCNSIDAVKILQYGLGLIDSWK